MENWQSEYLQFTLFILLTVWLLQRGSPESKELDKAGRESDQSQKVGPYAQQNSPRWAKLGGIRRTLYENSLVLVMGTFWLGTWLAQSVTGTAQYNAEQLDHHQDPVGWSHYITSADFWENTLQNWQSEFLAVGSMAILRRLPAPARLARVEAGRRPHTANRRGGLNRLVVLLVPTGRGRRPRCRRASSRARAPTARSPSETIPTGRPFFTTGSRRMSCSRIIRRASSTLASGSMAWTPVVAISPTAVDSVSRPSATARTAMSRSVTMPVTWPSSTTTTSPMSLSFITRAASRTLSSTFTVRGLVVMISSTVRAMGSAYPAHPPAPISLDHPFRGFSNNQGEGDTPQGDGA